MSTESNISIIEAVEALSSIADLDLDRGIGIMQKKELVFQDHRITFKTVQLMDREERELGIEQVKEVFGRVLRFLKNFYQNDFREVQDLRTLDGIKTVMVLVGEAAKKIDKYEAIVQKGLFKSVTETPDFKTLQDFYQKKIARTIDEGLLGKWLLAVTQQAWSRKPGAKYDGKKSGETKHVFIDLESVKKDTEYELFYIRKEDGTRFFSPRLIRNIKLVSDFGSYFTESKEADLLIDLPIWMNRHLNLVAASLVKETRPLMDRFFQEAYRFKDHEMVRGLSKALMALMLAADPKQLTRGASQKQVIGYFSDFLHFFRAVLRTREYEKLVTYELPKGHTVSQVVLDTCQGLAKALFDHEDAFGAVSYLVKHLIHEGKELVSHERLHDDGSIWSHLAASWQALSKVIKGHPTGPLGKVLSVIVDGEYNHYEPLNAENIPNKIFDLDLPNKRISVLRIPSPIIQESTDHARITPEWVAFLESQNRLGKRHLTINLQDRTSWRESARAFAVEKLDSIQPVITLATDTDFYHQTGNYYNEGTWDTFSASLLDQITDPQAGFYFSDQIRPEIESFLPRAIENLHSLLFHNKKIISREARRAFIDLLYLILSLKVIEITGADSVCFSCKDGLDTGNLFAVALRSLFETLREEHPSAEVLNDLDTHLFAPALLSRERLPLSEKFQRLVSLLHYLDGISKEMGWSSYRAHLKEGLNLLLNPNFAEAQAHKVVV